MSGHSKWATTKHQKAVTDARRAKSFAKLIKNIEVAAKLGGADLSGNPTLVDAIQKAKKTSVPKDLIDRAVKRGAGVGADAVDYQTIMYEGYAANGVAMLIECLTDNKNRAAADVRAIVSRNGGTMGDPGSVAYNFHRKGVIKVEHTPTLSEDDVMLAVLDSGAEEVIDHGHEFEVLTEPADLVANRTALQDAGIDLRIGRHRVRAEPQSRGRRRDRTQGVPPHRRARRQRRRAEHLQQLRPQPRGAGRTRERLTRRRVLAGASAAAAAAAADAAATDALRSL